MGMLRGKSLARDMDAVRSVLLYISRRMAREGMRERQVDQLDAEELQDLSKLVAIANSVLCRYEDKKAVRELLGEFVGIITDACESLDRIDDEVAELLVAAEDSIGRMKAMHAHISDKSDMAGTVGTAGTAVLGTNVCANNLTNNLREINPLEYQQNSQDNGGKVV